VAGRVPLVEQKLHSLPYGELAFSGVRVARSLIFCVMFCRSLFVLLYYLFWPLCCLSFFVSDYLPLVSFGHCVVCHSSFLITSLWYLFAIVLSVILRFTVSDYPFDIFWPLCCLSFFVSDYPFGIFWPLCCLSFFVSDYPFDIFKLYLREYNHLLLL
jgi:hypothetical protein